MCMAGWGKQWTRRCQGWNYFENRFCLRRTGENSREKYSIKEHLWCSRKSNKHFPLVWIQKGPYFLLLIHGPSHTSVCGMKCVVHRFRRPISMAALIARVMILGKGQIIPWKPSIADLIKSWQKVSPGSDRFQPWVFSARSELLQKWETSAWTKRDEERQGSTISNQASASPPTQLDLTLKSNEIWLA